LLDETENDREAHWLVEVLGLMKQAEAGIHVLNPLRWPLPPS